MRKTTDELPRRWSPTFFVSPVMWTVHFLRLTHLDFRLGSRVPVSQLRPKTGSQAEAVHVLPPKFHRADSIDLDLSISQSMYGQIFSVLFPELVRPGLTDCVFDDLTFWVVDLWVCRGHELFQISNHVKRWLPCIYVTIQWQYMPKCCFANLDISGGIYANYGKTMCSMYGLVKTGFYSSSDNLRVVTKSIVARQS